MKERSKYFISALIGVVMLAFAQGHAIDVGKVPGVKQLPAMQKATEPNSVQRIKNAAVIGAPKIISSTLIIDAPPFTEHCSAHDTVDFGGRVEVTLELPNHPVPSRNGAYLVVNTGSREDRTRIYIPGGKGRVTTVASHELRFNWPSDCNNSCVDYRIEGIQFDVAKNISTRNLKACVIYRER